jgi:hypothetical protein
LSRGEQFSFQKVPNKVTSIQKVNTEKKGRLICLCQGYREKFSNRKRKIDGEKGRNTRKKNREIGRDREKYEKETERKRNRGRERNLVHVVHMYLGQPSSVCVCEVVCVCVCVWDCQRESV